MSGPTVQLQHHYRDIPLDDETARLKEETQNLVVMNEASNKADRLEASNTSSLQDFSQSNHSLPFAQQQYQEHHGSNAHQPHEQFVVTQVSNGHVPQVGHPIGSLPTGSPVRQYVPRRRNFAQRNCGLCIKLCKWFPVVFILAVLAWGYYAFNVQLCFLFINSIAGKILLMIVFHFWYIMCLWSYYQTIFTNPGKPPREFWLTVNDMETINAQQTEEARIAIYDTIVSSRRLAVQARTFSGGYRTCEKCNLIKPDRAHHCSVCDACVLKMDHHCPWLVYKIC